MIYFDNAATTFPKPDSVIAAVQKGMVVYGGNPGRSGHTLSLKTSKKIFDIRERIAGFFSAQVENVIFTSNCTQALNMAIKGLLGDGKGHVLTSNMEHNSVLRPMSALQSKGKIEWEMVPVLGCHPDQMVKEFEKKIRPDTRAIVTTHASNVTGTVVPIRAIGKLCRERGIHFIVDAAQSAGVLPISLKDDGIDVLCTAGHKGLYGPTGTGLMIFAPDLPMETIMEGGTGSNSADLAQPAFSPDRFEAGTVNTVGICGLGAGVSFVSSVGIQSVYEHEIRLCQMLFHALSEMPHIILYDGTFLPNEKVPVISFNVRGKSPMETTQWLSDHGFALRGGLHCAPDTHQALGTFEDGTVRFSPSVFNREPQVEKLIFYLKHLR